jgi:hypothetical protein
MCWCVKEGMPLCERNVRKVEAASLQEQLAVVSGIVTVGLGLTGR